MVRLYVVRESWYEMEKKKIERGRVRDFEKKRYRTVTKENEVGHKQKSSINDNS